MANHVDMSDFPGDVYASAKKFEAWAANNFPRGKSQWLGLATTLDIPQAHLEMILARVWGQDVTVIRKIFQRARQ